MEYTNDYIKHLCQSTETEEGSSCIMLLLFYCFLWYNKSSEKGVENIWLVIQKIQKSLRTRT